MNCQVVLDNELHEKYLLDQLETAEKAAYEKHVKQCVVCGKELQALHTLIGGIRQAGQEEMKAEILRQADILELNRSGMNWGTIAKIAAVVLIFVLTPSVIYYLKRTETLVLPNTSEPSLHYESQSTEIAQSLAVEAESDVKTQSPARQQAPILKKKSPKILKRAFKKATEQREGLAAGDQPDQANRFTTKDDKAESGAKKQALLETGQIVQATAGSQPTTISIKPDSVEKPAGVSSVKTTSIIDSPTARVYTYQAPEDRATSILALDEARPISKGSDFSVPGNWRFTSDGHVIDIHTKSTQEERAALVKAGAWPDSFAVEIIARDSTRIAMNWLLPANVMTVDLRTMRLELNRENLLRAVIEGHTYQIEVEEKSGRAILTK
ncbi:MAG: hypothetical protein ACE5G1_09740 [bacterium]